MDGRAKLVLLVLCAANFLVGIDFSILNIALPAIGSDLHLGEANLQWVATAFALPSGGLLLLFGRTGDLIGRSRVFLAGIALFTAASLLTMLAWNPAALLAGRALQGLGAAGVVPTGMALLTTSFPEGRARDRALGIAGSLMATGFTVGTLLGGRADRPARLALHHGAADRARRVRADRRAPADRREPQRAATPGSTCPAR
jgi:MFS family permease